MYSLVLIYFQGCKCRGRVKYLSECELMRRPLPYELCFIYHWCGMYVRCKESNMKLQTIQKISCNFHEKIQYFQKNIPGARFNSSGTPLFGWNLSSDSGFFFLFCQCILTILYLTPLGKPFVWTNLNFLHPRMLCAKFGWNWPSGSLNFINVCSIFHMIIISPWKRAWPFFWTNINPHHPRMYCAKFGRYWSSGSGEGDFLASSM